MKKVKIHIVNGSDGYSLQVIDIDEDGGIRALGPKAWGNPYNEPTIVFDNVDAEKLCQDIMSVAKELENKPKIKLTGDEVIILKNIDKKYKYIARDDNSYGSLVVYVKEPIKRDTYYLTSDVRSDFDYLHGFYHLFQDVTFESGSHLIADLIKENEK